MAVILKNDIQNIENEIVNSVKPIFGQKLKKVILFGSYARGDYGEESDMDIMLMIDEDDLELRKYYSEITKIETEIDFKYDILVCTILQDEKKFKKYQDILPFYSSINSEGVVLYEQ